MDKKLFADLLESVKEMKAIREGKAKPARVTRYKALDPKAIREKSGLTQERFAALMGVKLATYRNWEQGRRVPHGPAQVLLMVADLDPAVIQKAIRAQREEPAPEGIAAYAHSKAGTAAPLRKVECPSPVLPPAFMAADWLDAEAHRVPGARSGR
jgi:putative transcriptional regulator